MLSSRERIVDRCTALRRAVAAEGNAGRGVLPHRRAMRPVSDTAARRRTVTEEQLAAEFETHRAYLHAITFRMLGSHADADDTVTAIRALTDPHRLAHVVP